MYVKIYVFLNDEFRNSLAVQRLGSGAFTAGAHGQSLVGELRFHKLCGRKKKKQNTHEFILILIIPIQYLSSSFA